MKINRSTFSGVLVPLITPMLNNAVDFDSLKKLCDYYLEHKADGFVVCGTTGEPATLTKEEKKSVIEFVIKHYSQQLPIVVGISASSTAVAVEEAKTLNALGVDGLLVLTPPYVKPSQAGIYEHYKHVANAVNIPVIIYNIPHRTGVNVNVETIKKLALVDNIIAIKESSGDINQLMDVINQTNLRVFTGEDHLVFITKVLGGHGAISAAAHVVLPEMKKILALVDQGDLVQAREIFKPTLEMIRVCFSEPNPSAIKAILMKRGLIKSNELRLPLVKATEAVLMKYAALTSV